MPHHLPCLSESLCTLSITDRPLHRLASVLWWADTPCVHVPLNCIRALWHLLHWGTQSGQATIGPWLDYTFISSLQSWSPWATHDMEENRSPMTYWKMWHLVWVLGCPSKKENKCQICLLASLIFVLSWLCTLGAGKSDVSRLLRIKHEKR